MIYTAIYVRADTLQSRRRNIASGVKRHFVLIVLITINYLKQQKFTEHEGTLILVGNQEFSAMA